MYFTNGNSQSSGSFYRKSLPPPLVVREADDLSELLRQRYISLRYQHTKIYSE